MAQQTAVNKVSIGRPTIGAKSYIQDIKLNQFTQMIEILIPSKNGMEWIKMSEEAARDIGFINPEAILKLSKIK